MSMEPSSSWPRRARARQRGRPALTPTRPNGPQDILVLEGAPGVDVVRN